MEINQLVSNAKKWLVAGGFPYSGKPETLTRQYLIRPLLEWLGWGDSPSDEFHFVSEFSGEMSRKWEDYVLFQTRRPVVFIECKSRFEKKSEPDLCE